MVTDGGSEGGPHPELGDDFMTVVYRLIVDAPAT